MPKYRKKPIVIEAVQYYPGVEHEALVWASSHLQGLTRDLVPYIETLEGRMRVKEGDYIIKGIAGEHYPCNPEIFEASYEPVEESPEALDN